MFPENEGFEFPRNPALDNEEAMRRATQVFYIMNEWATVWLAHEGGELTAEQVVEKFNDVLAPIGMAYKFEMSIEPEFLVRLVGSHEELVNRLAETEKEEN